LPKITQQHQITLQILHSRDGENNIHKKLRMHAYLTNTRLQTDMYSSLC